MKSKKPTLLKGKVSLCVVVSGEAPELGLREAERLIGKQMVKIGHRQALVRTDPEEVRDVLAKLYHSVLVQEVLLVKSWSQNPRIDENFYYELASKAEWGEVRNRAFAVRVRKIAGFPPVSSTRLAIRVAEAVYRACDGACRVDLTRPEVTVRLVTAPDAAVAGLLLLKLRRDRFRLRSNKFKPFKHPAALTPEDAGLLVNLSGLKSPVLDPFCGTGTVLIEAAVRGLESVGLDVDARMVRGSWVNVKAFSCDSLCHVVVGDARKPPFRRGFSAIVTDPPYGRLASTHGVNTEELFTCLVTDLAEMVENEGCLVYIRPQIRGKQRGEGAKGSEEYQLYVHGGLTRIVCILTRRSSCREDTLR